MNYMHNASLKMKLFDFKVGGRVVEASTMQ